MSGVLREKAASYFKQAGYMAEVGFDASEASWRADGEIYRRAADCIEAMARASAESWEAFCPQEKAAETWRSFIPAEYRDLVSDE